MKGAKGRDKNERFTKKAMATTGMSLPWGGRCRGRAEDGIDLGKGRERE